MCIIFWFLVCLYAENKISFNVFKSVPSGWYGSSFGSSSSQTSILSLKKGNYFLIT